MPTSAVEQQNGVSTLGDMTGDLIEMKLHGFGVGIWHGQSRAGPTCRADGAEEIGVLIALVGWLAGPRSASGPLTDEAILLADPGLVLEPDFDWCCFW